MKQPHKQIISALLLLTPLLVHAHGSMEIPLSRVYNCYKEGPEAPKSAACKAAVQAGGTQALYDWNGIRQGSANGNSRTIIPDGKLCSGGGDEFKGLDLGRTDWVSTSIAPDQSGRFNFVFNATAPHATKSFDFYITRDGYTPGQPLRWSDLEASPFCTITSVTLANGRYQLNCPLPQRSGKHVIYTIWQRSDSPEAFYACTDVRFGGGGGGGGGNPPPPPPTDWREIGKVRAANSLAVGTKVTFRLFNSTGQDAETHSVTLQSGMITAAQWPFFLAQQVNASSQLVNIGILDANGAIRPVQNSQTNTVYVKSTAQFTFAVDIQLPTNPGGGNGGGTTPGGGGSGPGGSTIPTYPTGIGTYKAGTIVRGTDGNRYQCRPFPNSGWCNQSSMYYAPGTGLAWRDAWIRL